MQSSLTGNDIQFSEISGFNSSTTIPGTVTSCTDITPPYPSGQRGETQHLFSPNSQKYRDSVTTLGASPIAFPKASISLKEFKSTVSINNA